MMAHVNHQNESDTQRDSTELEEELELRHLRGVAARFEVDASELKRLIRDLDRIEDGLLQLDASRSLLQRLLDRILPTHRATRQLFRSTINVLRMNLEEVARLSDAQRSADERQLIDLVDALVERLAEIDVLDSRLRAMEQQSSGTDAAE
jgi:hypothetical protein